MDPEPAPATAVAEDDKYAILFPGQGSQSLGMAGKVLEVYPEAEHWFQRANQILDYDLFELIERGPASDLDDTEHSQPAIFVASVAWLEALREKWSDAGRRLAPNVVSGHSMGQITAMLSARALDFDDALRLVRKRGELMREANLLRPGGMASIIGMRDRVLRRLVGEASDDGTIVVANDNCPGQTVVSGDVAPLRRLMRLAEEHGARRVVRLPISIASHSPLMEDAQAQFRHAVASVKWRDPVVPGRQQYQRRTHAQPRPARPRTLRCPDRPRAVADRRQNYGCAGLNAVRRGRSRRRALQARSTHLTLLMDLPALRRRGRARHTRLPRQERRNPQVTMPPRHPSSGDRSPRRRGIYARLAR